MSKAEKDRNSMLPYEPFAIADSASVRLPDVAKRSPLQVLIAYAVTVALCVAGLWWPFIQTVRFFKVASAWPELVVSRSEEDVAFVVLMITTPLLVFVTPVMIWVLSLRSSGRHTHTAAHVAKVACSIKSGEIPWFIWPGWVLSAIAVLYVIYCVGGAEECSYMTDHVAFIHTPHMPGLPVTAHMYIDGRKTISFALEQNGTAFTLGTVHDEQDPPFRITYDLAAGTVSSSDPVSASLRADSAGAMDIVLADGTVMSLLADGAAVRDASLYGGGEIVLRTVGTAPAGCRTLKVCTAKFPLTDSGRSMARVMFPLGLAMYRHAQAAGQC